MNNSSRGMLLQKPRRAIHTPSNRDDGACERERAEVHRSDVGPHPPNRASQQGGPHDVERCRDGKPCNRLIQRISTVGIESKRRQADCQSNHYAGGYQQYAEDREQRDSHPDHAGSVAG